MWAIAFLVLAVLAFGKFFADIVMFFLWPKK